MHNWYWKNALKRETKNNLRHLSKSHLFRISDHCIFLAIRRINFKWSIKFECKESKTRILKQKIPNLNFTNVIFLSVKTNWKIFRMSYKKKSTNEYRWNIYYWFHRSSMFREQFQNILSRISMWHFGTTIMSFIWSGTVNYLICRITAIKLLNGSTLFFFQICECSENDKMIKLIQTVSQWMNKLFFDLMKFCKFQSYKNCIAEFIKNLLVALFDRMNQTAIYPTVTFRYLLIIWKKFISKNFVRLKIFSKSWIKSLIRFKLFSNLERELYFQFDKFLKWEYNVMQILEIAGLPQVERLWIRTECQ